MTRAPVPAAFCARDIYRVILLHWADEFAALAASYRRAALAERIAS